jgi:hypothetical protein
MDNAFLLNDKTKPFKKWRVLHDSWFGVFIRVFLIVLYLSGMVLIPVSIILIVVTGFRIPLWPHISGISIIIGYLGYIWVRKTQNKWQKNDKYEKNSNTD